MAWEACFLMDFSVAMYQIGQEKEMRSRSIHRLDFRGRAKYSIG